MVISRRKLLSGVGAVAALWAGVKVRFARASKLRPPGALPPGKFERSCIRCFRCAEVCPVQCIRFDTTVSLVDMDTPYIDASARGCTLCMRCTQACPTGALQPIPDEEGAIAVRVKMGKPVLDKHACLAWSRSGVCRMCFYACPFQGAAVTVAGPSLGPVFHEDACVGCGLCEEACPRQAHAIKIVPLDGEPT